ncbi:MAG: CotH kinase family protein [Candidatus Omnitrophota bacterium]
MGNTISSFLFVALLCLFHESALGDVVINEIHYNPLDDAPSEFIELYNPASQSIDLSNYAFTEGVAYQIPPGTIIEPSSYLLVVKYTDSTIWRQSSAKRIGPYNGSLANTGERLTLRTPDGRIADSFAYSDSLPWPRGADGYGPTLERIAWDLPADDYHSWRASLAANGTPGKANSVANTIPRPMISSFRIDPVLPHSQDRVNIEFTLDSADLIQSVQLQYETLTTKAKGALRTLSMNLARVSEGLATYSANIPSQLSQTMVRFNIKTTLKDGNILRLPHQSEPRPFESYFVYDDEIPTLLPILWLFRSSSSSLPEGTKTVSSIAVKPTDGPVRWFDGADVRPSRNGMKISFIRGEDYRGDSTINIIPESPSGGTTAGAQSPHVEHLSYRFFEDFGVMVPRCDWYRVIESGAHTQRIVIQQPNEAMMELNGRDPNGNLYKIAYNEANGYTKKTNVLEGDEDFWEMRNAISVSNNAARAKALRRYLDIDEVMGYEVAGLLMSNWDGFFNNQFYYHNPPPIDKWEIIPWDLDKTFGFTDSDPMFVEMPLAFPLDGKARVASRQPGIISKPFHSDAELNGEYIRRVKQGLDGLLSIERVDSLTKEMEDFLQDDLNLLESYTGASRSSRRAQIQTSYETMRRFIRLRETYLRPFLPVSVEEWSVY